MEKVSLAGKQTFFREMVLLKDKPLLIEGCDNDNVNCTKNTTVEFYDSITKRWYPLAPLPHGIKSFTATIIDNETKVIMVCDKPQPKCIEFSYQHQHLGESNPYP